jgi:hypothetical protein
VVSIMVSALVVIWAVIELVILPGFFTHVWPKTADPLVAGAAMGMSVKTDGADAAAGELLDEFMRTKVESETDGAVQWPEGIITVSAVMTKIWIDMFIGLWAFILARCGSGSRNSLSDISRPGSSTLEYSSVPGMEALLRAWSY